MELRRGTAGWDVDPGLGRARRLETHAWHAKRMRISTDDEDERTWGFRLALSATRDPSKAVVRAARERVVVHDASYTRVLELRGPLESVSALLAVCLDPAEAAAVGLVAAVGQGRVAEGVFHRPGAFPGGALGPVRWLWRPQPAAAAADGDAAARSLWLWLHPACADEATAALAGHIQASSSASSVELHPIPDLLLFEIRGPGSHPLLQRVLCPAEGEGQEQEGNALWAGLLRHVSSARPETFPRHGTMLALRVMDPREARPCRVGPGGEEGQGPQRRRQKANKTRRAKLAALLHGKEEEQGQWPVAAAGSSLWSPAARAAAAADARARTDAVVNAARRRRRQAGTWQGVLTQGAEEKKEEDSVEGSAVPVLLVARGGRGSTGLFLDGGDLAGYDLILPRGWGRPFWHALLLHTDTSSSSHQHGRASGPRALGLEDRERLALEFGLPAFPRDWPDTPAGRRYWAAARAGEGRRQRRRPARKRVEALGLPRAWGDDGERGVVVVRRAAALEAAVAVAGMEEEGYLGRIFPESVGEPAPGRDDGGRRGQAASGATALLSAPRYRRLRPPPTPEAAVIPSHRHAAAVLLHCPWGGHPSPCATILAPAPTDYRAWRQEQAEAAAQRKCRAVALQAAAQARAAAALPSLSPSARPEEDEPQATGPGWAPSARPAALPQGATPRIALGAVTSAGFALGHGHAVARGLVSIDGLRRMQVGAARGVPAPMAGLVLVKDPRSGVAYPASLRLC